MIYNRRLRSGIIYDLKGFLSKVWEHFFPVSLTKISLKVLAV